MDSIPRTVPLLLLRVLADQEGAPAALLADIDGDARALPLAALATLAGDLPVYYRTGLDEEQAAALQQAEWEELPPGAPLRVDVRLEKDTIPPGTLLIEGDWCMAAPPRPSGAQAASRALSLQLAQLVAADAHTHDIEALLRKDPTLSYHLLRLVNSLGIGAGRRITSFSQAILILGRQQLRRWVNLMLFAARPGDPRSAMLLARVAVRGRLLEQLARTRGADKQAQDQAFIAGMFSLIGVLFGMPLAEVLAPLSISDSVQAALLRHEGELGTMLRLCEACEQGDAGALDQHLAALHVSAEQYNQAAIDANQWMLAALRGAFAGGHG